MKRIILFFSNFNEGTKASLALFLASVITSGIAYITTPVYTRLLPSAVFGQTSVFLTWLHIFGILAMFCFSNAVFNNGMADWPEERESFSFSILVLSNLITLLFAIVIIFSYPLVCKYIGLDLKYIVLMIGIFFFQPAYNFWNVRQRYEYKYKYVVFWSVFCAILSPLVSIAMILFVSESKLLEARVFGSQIPLILVYAGFYYFIANKAHFHLTTKYWKFAFLFNLPLIPHYLSLFMLNSSDKLMIAYLINDSATAYYSVAYSVGAVATIAWGAINSSLIPYTYEKCKLKDFSSIHKVTSPILTIFAVGCLLVTLLAPEIVAIMATSEYYQAIYVIPPIVGGVFFQVQYFMYGNVVFYYKQPKYIMYASVLSTGVNLVLNYIFISKYGYIAAGYTTLFCYMLQAFMDYLAMRLVVKVDVYNMKYILLLSLIVIAVSLISNLVYGYALIRYVAIFIIFVTGVLFKSKLIQMFYAVRK